MYETFFGLTQEPFSIAPDPRFLYLSQKHEEALGHLMYGLRRGGGFVLLTGEIGAGKTTVWRHFLEELPVRLDVAYVVNPKLGINALLTRVCEDLRVELPPGGMVDPLDALHGHLLLTNARGRRALIVVDEAQALSLDVLEQLRLLTNLVTSERKLVQVLLIGQPELRTMIQHPALEPLSQRIVARYHLPALPEEETARYIAHRMAVAGLTGTLPFDALALRRIHRLCGGVPRRINVLCDRALHSAQAAGSRVVDSAMVDQAAGEVFGPPSTPSLKKVWAPRLALAAVAAVVLLVGLLVVPRLTKAPAASVASIASAAATAALDAQPVPTPVVPASAPPQGPVATQAGPLASAVPATTISIASAVAAARALAAGPVAPVASPPAATDSLDAAFTAAAADEASAWRDLAGLWGVALGPGEPCAAAAQQSLSCFRGRGGLGAIRQLARPGIVKLSDERGRVAHLLLTGLNEQSATLRIGAVEQTVPLTRLASVWRGDFATFWRTPPGYLAAEPAATKGPQGTWLAQRLAVVEGAKPAAAPASGVDALKARVFAFQLAHDLEPDGLPGPLTLMQLNRASGVDEPRLSGRGGSP